MKHSVEKVKTKSNYSLVNPMLALRKQNTRSGDTYGSLHTHIMTSGLSFEFGIPIQEIHPAVMQMVWWKFATIVLQLNSSRLAR